VERYAATNCEGSARSTVDLSEYTKYIVRFSSARVRLFLLGYFGDCVLEGSLQGFLEKTGMRFITGKGMPIYTTRKECYEEL